MIELILNGTRVEVDVAPETRLIHVLRNHLGLKGAKYGCGEGACGACTVLVDGRAIQSCDVALEWADGRSVDTIEGLATSAGLHPLQQAFLDEQAAQCGFCTPGILMSAKALLDTNPDPDRNEIAAALDRNLCRCGAHVRVLDAVRRAARIQRNGGAG